MLVQNMVKNHHLAKSISDVSWSIFLNWVEYFGKIHGIVVVAVPPQYTSQDCSRCGHRQKKTLSTRTHECVKCGLKLHRDHNSAIEIRSKGLQKLGASTVGLTGIHACEQNDLCLNEETHLSKPTGRSRKSVEQSMESPTIVASAKRGAT